MLLLMHANVIPAILMPAYSQIMEDMNTIFGEAGGSRCRVMTVNLNAGVNADVNTDVSKVSED